MQAGDARQAGGERHVELADRHGEDHLRGRDGDPLSRGQPLAGCDGGGAEDELLAPSTLRQGGWYAHRVRPGAARGGAGAEAGGRYLIGNDKPRNLTGGNPLATPFLQLLADAGWSSDSVDAVI